MRLEGFCRKSGLVQSKALVLVEKGHDEMACPVKRKGQSR